MLTIREPISLHIQRPIQKIRQDLSERMQANYGLMSLPIRREELLHITSEPPEVYFGEGSTVQIFNDMQSEEQQELRLDVINNVINRILVAQTDNFTYQDTVYISSILRKLGIRDEKQFMKQVFHLQQEHKETTALLQQYEQHQELLFNLFRQERETRQTTGGQGEMPAAPMQRYYLHDEIFKRLETGKIYQDLRAYTKGVRHESQQIFRNEYSIGEQAAMAKQFHLHSLKQKLLQMDTPLLYFHQNQYEFLQETLEELSQTTEERISAAVLLNLIDQSYALRQQQIEENNHYWYSLAGALFQTAENTWKRFESNLTERKHISPQMIRNWEEVQIIKQREGDMIQQIAEEYHIIQQQFRHTAEHTDLMQPRYFREGDREEITLSGGSFHLTQEELKLEYLQDAAEEEAFDTPAAVTVEQIQQQLEQIHRKNQENYQKLMQIQIEQPKMIDRRPDRRRAQMDALRALENPTEVLQEFLSAEVRDTVQETNREMYEKLYEMFSEETKEIYRQYLQQNPSQENTFLQEIMRQPMEREIQREHTERVHSVQQETEQTLETALYERFSDRTRAVYEQFLEDHTVQEESFLEHVLYQPVESEVQREVVSILEELTQQELTERVGTKAEYRTEQRKVMQQPVINENLRQQMWFLQELQTAPLYQQWTQQEIWYVQVNEAAEDALQQIQQEQTQILQKQEHMLHTIAETVSETISEAAERTFPQMQEAESIEEIAVSSAEHIRIEQQERQFVQIQQTIEKQIRRQEQEKLTELAEQQREQRFRQIDFVHKREEQLLDEEMLETIRTRQMQTRREEHTQEQVLHKDQTTQTVVQNAMHNVQVQQTQNIDELVQQKVRKQLNQLSDQIYGKIEKKLATERKRRGY